MAYMRQWRTCLGAKHPVRGTNRMISFDLPPAIPIMRRGAA